MSDANSYVLAMYDIRGKQSYIYKSSKMKEIVGASLIIRDCFLDYLFPAAEQTEIFRNGQRVNNRGIYSYRTKKETKPDGSVSYVYKSPEETEKEPAFSEKNFIKHLEEGYLGEVVYDGGGNFFVLYRDAEVYRAVNRRFYVDLLKGTYSLRVLTSYVEGVDFGDYRRDESRLYEIHRRNEHQECALQPVNALPIVQVDPGTCLPLGAKLPPEQAQGRKDDKVSLESLAKYEKYARSVDKNTEGARILDELITEKGVDSQLAIIYIDGNSMGTKVENATNPCKTYEESAAALRAFSAKIQQEYIDIPMEKIDEYFEGKPEAGAQKKNTDRQVATSVRTEEAEQPMIAVRRKNEARQKRRFVIYAGDEINFICNASDAYEVVNLYFSALNPKLAADNEAQKETGTDAGAETGKTGQEINSSCAGVAIFHSHAPYAEAYRIAEECCETGKKLMKEKGINNACFLDFHLCQGAIGTSLEDIREKEGTENLCAPWRLDHFNRPEGKDAGTPEKPEIEEMAKLLNQIARGNGKTLLSAAKTGEEAFRLELSRIKAHTTGKTDKEKTLREKLEEMVKTPGKYRALIYRMMVVYDWWFRKAPEGGEKA